MYLQHLARDAFIMSLQCHSGLPSYSELLCAQMNHFTLVIVYCMEGNNLRFVWA